MAFPQYPLAEEFIPIDSNKYDAGEDCINASLNGPHLTSIWELIHMLGSRIIMESYSFINTYSHCWKVNSFNYYTTKSNSEFQMLKLSLSENTVNTSA